MIGVLVTGSNGQLGKSIAEIADDYPGIRFDFKDSKELDITSEQGIIDLFSTEKYNYCINCAAYTDVDGAEKNEVRAFTINAEGVKYLAKACSQNGTVLIHVSTDYVFDGEKSTQYGVSDRPNPINIYGKSKLQGEIYLREILKKYFIVRTSWLYSNYGKNFYKAILKKAKAGEDLHVIDSQTGCPTHASNLANYILRMITSKRENYGVHHFTDGIAMTWFEFAHKILVDNNLRDSIILKKAENYCTLATRPKNSVLEQSP